MFPHYEMNFKHKYLYLLYVKNVLTTDWKKMYIDSYQNKLKPA